MTVLFYRHDKGDPVPVRAALPPGLELRLWQPARDGLPHGNMRSLRRLAIWAQDRIGCFSAGGFTELSIWREQLIIHRLIVTPRWFRFPFMADEDLQIGDVWTHPDERGTGLARAAIAEAHFLFGRTCPKFWYIAEASNIASVRLVEASGYRLVGTGRRTRPLGLSPLGRFHLRESASS